MPCVATISVNAHECNECADHVDAEPRAFRGEYQMKFSFFGGDAAAKLAALDKSQATIEFKMDGTIITANKNFLNAM